MKKIFFVFFLFGKSCFAQTILDGKLTSFPNANFSILSDQSSLNDYAGVLIGQGKTDNSGQFSCTIDLSTEEPVNLFIGNAFFLLWAKPNTTLTIQERSNHVYVFSGDMAKENEVFYKSGIMQPYNISTNIGTDKFQPANQLHYLDSLEAKRLLILKEKNGALSGKFLSYYNTEVSGYSYFNKSQYPALCKATNKISEKDIPKDYFKFWDNFTLQDDSTKSASYLYALQDFIDHITLERIGPSVNGSEKYWSANFQITDSLLQQHPLTWQKLKAATLFVLIKYYDYPQLTSRQIENFTRQFPLSAALTPINNLWQKKHGPGSASPSFRLRDDTGKWVDIKDFTGKVVYIDFWGSWCKACIANMPQAALLKEKFKGRYVVFLYIDFFDTEPQWRSAIKKYGIDGIHLKAEKNDEAYFNTTFNIGQGFPRYALIDKEGKLVTISAPPPNSEAAYILIKKYLGD